MKKIMLAIGGIIIISFVTMIIIFLIFTKNVNKNTLSISNEYFIGTWCVAQSSERSVINEYFIFNENYVSCYYNKNENTCITSDYSIKDTNRLIISDISKEFIIEKVSNNIVKLIDINNKETWNLLRCSEDEFKRDILTDYSLEGSWKVLFHAGELVQDEILVFKNGLLTDYRNKNPVPYLESTYEWTEDGCLLISKLKLKLKVLKIDDNSYGLIEIETGYIWEIERS